jgi:DNA-binding response OmpR family regulator
VSSSEARSQAKILLVDDEPLVREELGALLEEEGYLVVRGSDGEEGLVLFRREQPDMVISDVRMPRRDGLSLAMTIRQEDPLVPVTVITGHGTESMAILALRAGVTDFIKKPVRLEDLTAALQRMESVRRPAELLGMGELPAAVELVENTWTYRLQNDLLAIPHFVDVLVRRCGAGLGRSGLLELSLAVREVLTNAVEHGNLELTYQDKTRALESGTLDEVLRERAARPELSRRRITVLVSRQERRLDISITDEGPGFDWTGLPDPSDPQNLLLAHGRGVLLARLSVDSMVYSGRGNQVTLSKVI